MARYFARTCPKCCDIFNVAITHLAERRSEFSINGFCGVCGHQLKGWRLILCGKRAPEIRYGRMRKVFR
jgi:hypothetical protein